MARTAQGAELTIAHRRGQLRVRAGALRDYLALWPLWRGDEESFRRLMDATLPLIGAHRRISSSLAGAYYEAFRRAERVGGQTAPRLAAPADPSRIRADLYVTGRQMTTRALLAGQSPQAAMQTALVRTSGAVGTQVLDGARQTIMGSIAADRQAVGWSRVASGSACAFCEMMCSRGPAYTEDGADFSAHNHCACSAEPTWEGSESAWPAHNREMRALWDRHTAGSASGEQLNDFRRALSARQ